ncbi:hypothetical protein TNCV_4689181 [Trichonephila clavipes]|nr:hypothetical protein TNCV_4689181 [Trichonephila clavipes]
MSTGNCSKTVLLCDDRCPCIGLGLPPYTLMTHKSKSSNRLSRFVQFTLGRCHQPGIHLVQCIEAGGAIHSGMAADWTGLVSIQAKPKKVYSQKVMSGG